MVLQMLVILVIAMTIQAEADNNPFRNLVLKEVSFVGGFSGTSSYYSDGYHPDNAFRRTSSFWHSGGDSQGQGELNIPLPHLIWYSFTTPFIPGRVSFRPRPDEGCGPKGYWCGATEWQFIGTNDEVCNRYSAWTILCEDRSGTPFRSAGQSKYCNINESIKEKFKCLGISVLGSSYTGPEGFSRVSLTGIRMWERVFQKKKNIQPKSTTQRSTKKPRPNPNGSCGTPSPLPNGYLEYSSTNLNSRIILRCNPGYDLIGRDRMFCTAVWSAANENYQYLWAPQMATVCKVNGKPTASVATTTTASPKSTKNSKKVEEKSPHKQFNPQVKSARAKFGESQKELMRLRAECTSLKQQMFGMETDMSMAEKAWAVEKAALEGKIASLRAQMKTDMSKAEKAWAVEKAALEGKIASLRAQMETDMSKAEKAWAVEKAALEGEIASLRAQLANQDEELKQLMDSKLALDAEISTYRQLLQQQQLQDVAKAKIDLQTTSS